MKLHLVNKITISLPRDYNLEERKAFVEDILKENCESFVFDGTPSDRVAQIRLDILATYLLDAVEGIRDDVMSRYKITRRPYQEMSISCLGEVKQDKIVNIFYSKGSDSNLKY